MSPPPMDNVCKRCLRMHCTGTISWTNIVNVVYGVSMHKGTSHGSDARRRIQTASADTFSSESHYRLVCRHIRAGDAVHPSDHRFYRRYCQRNGLEPLEARTSASVPRISLSESAEERYGALVATLKNGGGISGRVTTPFCADIARAASCPAAAPCTCWWRTRVRICCGRTGIPLSPH